MQEFIFIVPLTWSRSGNISRFLALTFYTSKSFHHFFVGLVNKFKGKLKIGAPLDYSIRAWCWIPSSTSIANDRRTKDETGTSLVGRIAQADYTFSFVIKHGKSQRENNVSLITRLDSTRYSPLPSRARDASFALFLFAGI